MRGIGPPGHPGVRAQPLAGALQESSLLAGLGGFCLGDPRGLPGSGCEDPVAWPGGSRSLDGDQDTAEYRPYAVHEDCQHTVRALSDAGVAVVERYRYPAPYGETETEDASGNPLGPFAIRVHHLARLHGGVTDAATGPAPSPSPGRSPGAFPPVRGAGPGRWCLAVFLMLMAPHGMAEGLAAPGVSWAASLPPLPQGEPRTQEWKEHVPGPPPVLWGRVLSEEGPVPGAVVALGLSGSYRATADAEGWYALHRAPSHSARQWLHALAPGLALTCQGPVRLGGPEPVRVDFRLDREARLSGRFQAAPGADPGRSLQAELIWVPETPAETRSPLHHYPMALIAEGITPQTLDISGVFSFDHLRSGLYEIRIVAPESPGKSRRVLASTRTRTGDGFLLLKEGRGLGSVRARVVDARSRQPLRDFEVSVWPSGPDSEQRVSRSAGDWSLEGLVAGRQRIQVSAEGYWTERWSVDIEEGQNDLGLVYLGPEVTLDLRLLDRDGQPVPQAVLESSAFRGGPCPPGHRDAGLHGRRRPGTPDPALGMAQAADLACRDADSLGGPSGAEGPAGHPGGGTP